MDEAPRLPERRVDDGTAGVPRRLLGELLVRSGLISELELEHALQEQRESGGRLGEVLLALGLVSLPELMAVLTEQHGLGPEPRQSLRERLRPLPEPEAKRAVGL